jgi:hypothetical protein
MSDKYNLPSNFCADPKFTLTDKCASNDSDIAESYAAELIEISGAPLNIYRLLGVHEQGRLIDLTGEGNPLSGGTAAGYLLQNAFTDSTTEWHSSALGAGVLDTFLGYSFGTKRTAQNKERYAAPQPIRQSISSIRVQQGPNPLNRVTQARIERSDDGGLTWIRAAVVALPDTDAFELVSFKATVPSQMWRIVPIQFNGLTQDLPWVVVRLEMMDYEVTRLSNVQDKLLLENRDRDYAQEALSMKAQYDIIDIQSQFARFGIDLPDQYTFTVSFAKMVELLGRPLVVGDIIELPAEAQYDQNLNKVRKWLEIEDTGWSSSGFSPNWRPVLFRFTASPLIARQETRDLFSTKRQFVDAPDSDFLEDMLAINTIANESSDYIKAMSLDAVPETGTDSTGYDVDDASMSTQANETFGNRDLYVEDGIPANGAEYGEGQDLPKNPVDGEFFRLVYPDELRLPARLFRYSTTKGKWIYQETDRRQVPNSHRPSVRRVMESNTKFNIR